jgi:RNA polymerase sigma-70 factor (ECF subfamily)
LEDWDQILDDFGPMVWKQTLRLLGNASDAADCFQITMLEAFELSGRQEIRNWGALLRRLAILRSLDRLRARYRERKDPRPVDEIAIVAKDSPTDNSIDEQELAEHLRMALTKLPANQAEAFGLRWVDGLSNEQVAKQMGITTNHTRVLLHRARLALHKLLSDEWENRS